MSPGSLTLSDRELRDLRSACVAGMSEATTLLAQLDGKLDGDLGAQRLWSQSLNTRERLRKLLERLDLELLVRSGGDA